MFYAVDAAMGSHPCALLVYGEVGHNLVLFSGPQCLLFV